MSQQFLQPQAPQEETRELDPFGFKQKFGGKQGYIYGDDAGETMLSRWELDFSLELDAFEHKLRREVLRPDGNWERIDDVTPPILNQKGIAWLLTYLHPIMTKNTYLSDYDKAEIKPFVLGHVITILKHLYLKHDEYGLHIDDWIPLIDDCESMVFSAYNRAKGGGEREYRKMIVQQKILESRTERDETRKKKGIFSGFNLFGNDRSSEE